MALVGNDLTLVTTGSGTTANPHLSLGGTINPTEEISVTDQNNIMDDIDGGESKIGNTDYRVVAIRNSSSTDTALRVMAYFSQNGSGYMAMGLNEAAGTDPQELPNEMTIPSGVLFAHPSNLSSAIDVGNLAAGQSRPLYLRRTTPAGITSPNDDVIFEIKVEAES